MHMALGHPCIMLWWGGYSERRIVISDSCGGLYSRTGIGSRLSQVGESEVGDEVAGGTAAARTARQNNRVDRFGLDAGVFDRTNRSFQCEFESALLCATSVGSLADTNYARSVSQISKLRHFNLSQLPRPECRRGHEHKASRIPANRAVSRRCFSLSAS